MSRLKILDVVALLEDVPEEGLRRGEVGTVVEQWADGVYEVEFSDRNGVAFAFAAVGANQLMKLHYRDAA